MKLKDYDVIHAANFRAAMPPIIARKNYILTLHDIAPMRMYHFRGYLQKLAVKKSYRNNNPDKGYYRGPGSCDAEDD